MASWRPDWRDAKAYALTEEFAIWQFVRRNPEYSSFWRSEVEPDPLIRDSLGFGRLGPNCEDLDTSREQAIARECIERWGFSPPSAPEVDSPSLMFVGTRASHHMLVPGLMCELGSFRQFLLPSKRKDLARWATMRIGLIDLDIEVGPQIERIRRTALNSQKRLGIKPSRSKTPTELARWACYLRLLDAKHARAKHAEIAHQFETEGLWSPLEGEDSVAVDKVAETLKQARRLMKPEGYLKILGLQ